MLLLSYNNIIFSDKDWKKQPKEFHKEFSLKHPEEHRSPNEIENQFIFSWPPNNEFSGVQHKISPTMTGNLGKELVVANVWPRPWFDGSELRQMRLVD